MNNASDNSTMLGIVKYGRRLLYEVQRGTVERVCFISIFVCLLTHTTVSVQMFVAVWLFVCRGQVIYIQFQTTRCCGHTHAALLNKVAQAFVYVYVKCFLYKETSILLPFVPWKVTCTMYLKSQVGCTKLSSYVVRDGLDLIVCRNANIEKVKRICAPKKEKVLGDLK